MENETFELLVRISKLEFFDFRKPKVTNIDIEKYRINVYRKLNILLNKGFISYNDNETYSITQLGYNISLHENWSKFLEFQKRIIDKGLERDKNDLTISRFQVKTRNLPFIFSSIGIVLSVIAIILSITEYNEDKSNKKQDSNQQEILVTEKQHKSLNLSKVDSTNSK